MKIMVTGAAGFMGSHFLRLMMNKYPKDEFVNLDKLTYAGNLGNVMDLKNKPNYEFVQGDICDFGFMRYLLKGVDVLFNFAAESHVDNSILGSIDFTRTDALGVHTLLEASRINNVKKVVHISTDEVYGEKIDGTSKEDDPLKPTNPYSASKAAGEMIIRGYQKTYGLPIITVRGNNNIGPNQYPEKVVPRFATSLLQGKKVPLHGTGKNIRTFIYVEDFANGLETIFRKGEIGEIYNIGTSYEISNLELTRKILKKLGKDESYIDFVPDRPFNDRRYHIDSSKLETLGWAPKIGLEEALDITLDWYKSNREWWGSIYKKMKHPNLVDIS